MRLLICAGGTGGGVYPALAVLQALVSTVDQADFDPKTAFLWVGGIGGMEADLVKRVDLPFEAIPAAGVHGVGIRTLPGNLLKLWRGYQASRQILNRFQPDVLFFTGGYVAVPMALAGRHIASALYVPDIEPGLALKSLARLASSIAITADDSRLYFKRNKNLVVTGYPTRSELLAWDRETALRTLDLRPDLPILLVFGGSKGARSINQALLTSLADLLREMQIIHISGSLDWPDVQAAMSTLTVEQASRYRAYPYLHDNMGAALRVASLALSRAGASSLGELPLFGLPAILVPYPYAWRYQRTNAQYLVRHGAAVMAADEELSERLSPIVLELIRDKQRLSRMQIAMRSLARPEAAAQIADMLQKLAGSPGRGRN